MQWQQLVIVFISILSMALGSFAAIGQTDIKRMMAYSAIGNMGFALVGLAAGTPDGVQGRGDLHGDLPRHDARHLRRDPVDEDRRAPRWTNVADLMGLSKTHPEHGLLPR